MSCYLAGKRSTDKQFMMAEPPHLKSGRKDRTIRFQDKGGQHCLPSTQSNRGAVDKPAVNSNPPSVDSQQKKIVDVSLRTRLIHLLAIKPYTKAELCDRITKEGIDQRSRCVLIMILKQLTYFEEGVYYLRSCFMNEVQADWPYYTEEEQAIFKKKKPQSATPGSSNESSGSRQSSVDPRSPPLIRPPIPQLTRKRLGHHQCNDGVLRKKPRIYPYRNPMADSNNNSTTSSGSRGRTADNTHNNNGDQQGVMSAASNGSGGSRSNISDATNTSEAFSKRKSPDKKVKMLVSIPIKKIKIDCLRNGATLSR